MRNNLEDDSPGGAPPNVGASCDVDNHPWIKELADGGGEIINFNPSDNLDVMFAGLSPGKRYALLPAGGSYPAASLPNGVDFTLVGGCDAVVVGGLWQGAQGSQLRIARINFEAGLRLDHAVSAQLKTNSFKNPAGDALAVAGGDLLLEDSQFGLAAGHAVALDALSGVIIGDNHFLGPLGGDGVFSDELEGTMRITGNRFAEISGNGLRSLGTKASVSGVIIGDNHFLGPLGGDGVFSSNDAPLAIQGNRFNRIGGNGVSLIGQLSGIIIGDNHFLGPLGGDGVFSQGSGSADASSVERNAIDNSGRFGVFLDANQGSWTLKRNIVSASAERGVLIQDMNAESTLEIRDNIIEGVLASGIELIGVLSETNIQGNHIDKVRSLAQGGAHAPANGFGIAALDSPRIHIHGNELRGTGLAGILVDLAQSQHEEAQVTPLLRISDNAFDGQSKYNVVLQNTGDANTEGDEISTRSGSAAGFGERFRIERRRAASSACGNGQVDDEESCDDGNRYNGDACSNACQVARCGDGLLRRDLQPDDAGFEACDFGDDNSLCSQCQLLWPQTLASGDGHNCALIGGQVSCWGDNQSSQVDGSARGSEPIVRPEIMAIEGVIISVAAGASHSCLISENTSHCFGRSAEGQLFASARFLTYHNQVWRAGASSLSAGGNASCVVMAGNLFCMGTMTERESFGQITPLAADQAPTRVAIGAEHYCIESASGVYCAGSNRLSQIDDDDNSYEYLINISQTASLRVAVGSEITCLIEEGQVRCRGSAGKGRLGRGGNGQCGDECARTWGQVSNLTTIIDLKIGDSHVCALDAYGRVFCWGDNSRGALGIGDSGIRSEPGAQVPLPLPVATLSVGKQFSCAQLIDERVFCWGQNDRGQLGRNFGSAQEAPGAISP
ncbi:MAG: right-handed parallel beta-helix repeat-containing protein [Myxococcota bacterium]|nr:right-handed parallel beta-helix repeat-containing protein [Myxococcota bacterium]